MQTVMRMSLPSTFKGCGIYCRYETKSNYAGKSPKAAGASFREDSFCSRFTVGRFALDMYIKYTLHTVY